MSVLQVVFEGVRGSGFYSDIAIDDVKMQASCPPPGNSKMLLVRDAVICVKVVLLEWFGN